jgi:hypothetical protein
MCPDHSRTFHRSCVYCRALLAAGMLLTPAHHEPVVLPAIVSRGGHGDAPHTHTDEAGGPLASPRTHGSASTRSAAHLEDDGWWAGYRAAVVIPASSRSGASEYLGAE